MVNLGKWRSVTATAHPKKQARIKESFACKVQRGYFQKRSNNASVDGRIQLHPPEPWIQLRGYWLNQVGFTVDLEFTVEATTDCITLRPKRPINKLPIK